MVTTLPDLKDAITAIIGASVSLGGLLLIFSGYLYAQAAIMPTSTPNTTLNRYRNAARIGLYPFAVALALAAFSVYYWFAPCAAIAHIIMAVFTVLVVGTIVYGFWATRLL
jgi:hypothetical protein